MLSKHTKNYERRMKMMNKIREYWTTIDGEPKLAEFADYVLSLIDTEDLRLIDEIKSELPTRGENCDSTDHEYSWAMGFDDAIDGTVKVIERVLSMHQQVKKEPYENE